SMLTKKERLIAISKIDLLTPSELSKIKSSLLKKPIDSKTDQVFISAVANQGIEKLLDELWRKIHSNE
ncbi:MAG: GTPase ObgE, partial [Ignavibacteria bacterium]|nr:GTPase ObgE [Ignavibacteria bacterium]